MSNGKQMIPDTRRLQHRSAQNWPIFRTINPVGMERYTETATDGFSDRCLVLDLSGYAYQEASSSVRALKVVKLPEAKRGFVLLPRRWVVERSFGWMSRARKLARDYERLLEMLAGLHIVAFIMLMLR